MRASGLFKYEARTGHLDPTEGIRLVAFPAFRRGSLAETGFLDGRTGLTIPSASAAAIPREGRSPRACRSPRHRSPSMLRPGEGDARIMRPPQRGVDKISEISELVKRRRSLTEDKCGAGLPAAPYRLASANNARFRRTLACDWSNGRCLTSQLRFMS